MESLREEGIKKFLELGFPTPENEDWRFTNVTPIARTVFSIENNGHKQISPGVLDRFTFPKLKTIRLVFVDGSYIHELSDVSGLPKGVEVMSLASALSSEEELVKKYLSKYADFSNEAFTALNTAFMQDGGFVYIPGGTRLREPVHLLYITADGDNQTTKQRRLRAGKVINPIAVWYHAVCIYQICKVADHIFSGFGLAIGKQAKYSKEAIPIIYFAEPAAGNYVRIFKRKQCAVVAIRLRLPFKIPP
jgi:hypothetical protein